MLRAGFPPGLAVAAWLIELLLQKSDAGSSGGAVLDGEFGDLLEQLGKVKQRLLKPGLRPARHRMLHAVQRGSQQDDRQPRIRRVQPPHHLPSRISPAAHADHCEVNRSVRHFVQRFLVVASQYDAMVFRT